MRQYEIVLCVCVAQTLMQMTKRVSQNFTKQWKNFEANKLIRNQR